MLHILQVNKDDISGGASNVAWNLFAAYRTLGHESCFAVGKKSGDDPDVIVIPNQEMRGTWEASWRRIQHQFEGLDGHLQSAWRFSRWAHFIANPAKWLDEYRGIEDFTFPGTWSLLQITKQRPDVIHCHNLHSDYFDLRSLPWISAQVPTIVTLHDAWLLSGHCAHSFDCERWRIGCGSCPDLSVYVSVKRDATRYNWKRKRNIYAKSKLYVATPSRWLMREVQDSILNQAIIEKRVIPYGIDLSIFRPADKDVARESLNIRQDAQVLLFAANGIKINPFKDYFTLRRALSLVAKRSCDRAIVFIGLGENESNERIDHAEIRFVPYQNDPQTVAKYYQAADLYLHAARADTFPNSILEALACGAPVVATAVGGIPEQIKGLRGNEANQGLNNFDPDEATGILVSPGDAEEMALGIEKLLGASELRRRLRENAVKDAEERFDLKFQVKEYLEWYGEIVRGFSPTNQLEGNG